MKTKNRKSVTSYTFAHPTLTKVEQLHNETRLTRTAILELLIESATPIKIKRLLTKAQQNKK